MARRGLSRRGGSASQPQVKPYQQIELEDGWREWENTKQELAQVKRQLTEMDALVVQLKTTARRLQETLRKKDKDLQAAFAILRSPQDAKTTKTRRQELMDRLVTESIQRAVTAEALAEERRQELGRLKYSSKFLRFQELEVEIGECHLEIERLRAKLETTTAGSPIIAGKLKVSAVQNGVVGLTKKLKPTSVTVQEDRGPEHNAGASANIPTRLSPIPVPSVRGVGQVRVVPLGKLDRREGFVSKTRRRAADAEYYKQVRLAQLEVECELEENLHLRAAREAKRVQFADQRPRAANEAVAPVRMLANSSSVEDCRQESLDDDDRVKLPSVSVVADRDQAVAQQNDARKLVNGSASKNPEHIEGNQTSKETLGNPTEVRDDNSTTVIQHQGGNEGRENNGDVPTNPPMYESDEFDGGDDPNSDTDGNKHHDSVWNVDPTPENTDQNCDDIKNYHVEGHSANNGNDVVAVEKSSAWNVDPNPSDPASPSLIDQTNTDTVVWNVTPATEKIDSEDHHSENGSVSSNLPEKTIDKDPWNLDPVPSSGKEDESIDPLTHRESQVDDIDDYENGSVSSDPPDQKIDDTVNTPWNLNPIPPNTSTDEEDEPSNSIAEENGGDDNAEKDKIWNVDPDPTRSPQASSPASPDETPHEVVDTVWNVDPQLSSEVTTVAAPNPNVADNPSPSSPVEGINAGSAASPWNLKPLNPSEEISENGAAKDLQVESRGETLEPKAWNLDPNASTSTPASEQGEVPAVDVDEPQDRPVWNLDPHTGDFSSPDQGGMAEPPNAVDNDDENVMDEEIKHYEIAVINDDAVAEVAQPIQVDQPIEIHEEDNNSPVLSEGGAPAPDNDQPPAEDAADNYTPDYTPPSTARDSNVDEEDTSW